jgi:hypothetical protein
MNTRSYRSLLAVVAIPLALVVTTPASADIFGDAVKGVSRTVSHAAKDVGHAGGKVVKGVSRTVSHAAKDVGHAAESAGRDAGRAAGKATSQIGRTYMGVARPVGTVVSKTYGTGARIVEQVPVLKSVAPLARDAARAATSDSGKIGAAAGAGLAIATGGASSVALAAGRGGLTVYYGEQAYKNGKRTVNQEAARARRDIRDIRRSYN